MGGGLGAGVDFWAGILSEEVNEDEEEEHVAVFDLVVSVYWRGKKTLLQATLKSRACNRRHFNFSLSLVSLPKKEKKITRLLSNIQRSNYYKQERNNFQFTGVKWV